MAIAKKIKGQTKLAARLDLTQQRVSKLIQADDWRWSKTEWDEAEVEEINQWRQQRKEESGLQAEDPIDAIRQMGPERQWKLKLLAARVAKLEAEQKLLLKQYVLRDDVERDRVQRVLAVKSELMNSARLVAMLETCASPAEMETKVQEWGRGICDRFAGESN